MDLHEARIELDRPLVFGDQRQIEARDYLNLLQEIRARMERCAYCLGAGFRLRSGCRKPLQCRCIRNEPTHVKADLHLYRDMADAELRMRDGGK